MLDVPLVKASHMATLRVSMGEDTFELRRYSSHPQPFLSACLNWVNALGLE